MNSIRHIVLAGSLVAASLVPSSVHAQASGTSPVNSQRPSSIAPAPTGGAGDGLATRSGPPLSSGLLALGAANEAGEAARAADQSQDASFARREQAAPALRDFRGGRVYVYLGGGVTLLLVLLLILILL